MPTMKLYQNGVSAYMGGVGTHERAPRGEIRGWTKAAARRQTQWLWTVNAEDLDGFGYALTLTMRDTPDTAADFEKARTAWIRRLERMGATRIHWVVEWQRRGTPHIHAAVYFDRELSAEEIPAMVGHWLAVAGVWGAAVGSQYWDHIRGPLGWLKYLSKHASRGAAHYQRQGHPEGWNKTGRLWGHRGEWPVVEPLVIDSLRNEGFWRVRRMMRAWAVADARKVGDWKRVRYLRRAGRPNTRQLSSYQGVAEWIPESVSLRLLDFLAREEADQ